MKKQLVDFKRVAKKQLNKVRVIKSLVEELPLQSNIDIVMFDKFFP